MLQGSPADLATIAAAQQQLNVTFSQDYIEFLQLFGCGVVGAYPVFGLGRKPDAMSDNDDVINQTLHFRGQGWPGTDECYVVSTDGRGNPIIVDSFGNVLLSDHDVGDVVRIAESFEAFLGQCLSD